MKKTFMKYFVALLFLILLMGSVSVSAASKTEYILNVTASNAEIKSSKMSLYTGGATTKLTVKLGKKKASASRYSYKKLSAKAVTYQSSNTSVATVSKKGVITPKKAGTTVLTLTYKNKKLTNKITVTVKKPAPKLSKTSLTLYVGKSSALSVTGTSSKVTWSSSKKRVATVSAKGVVKAVKKGTATVTAKVNGKKLKCKVTVKKPEKQSAKQPVTSVKLDQTSVTLGTYQETVTLNATVAPTSASDKTLAWSSSDAKVAKVDSKGKVTAMSEGTATITATAKDGSGKKASCKVAVVFDAANVLGQIWELTPGVESANPTVRIRFMNNTNETIYVDWLIFAQDMDQIYVKKAKIETANLPLYAEGYEDAEIGETEYIAIQSGEMKEIYFYNPKLRANLIYYDFTPYSYITVPIKAGGKESVYVFDLQEDNYDMEYTGYASRLDYARSRASGSLIDVSAGNLDGYVQVEKRVCPMCRSNPGKCSNCGGSGIMKIITHSWFGNTCRTCNGSGKCVTCKGTGYY